jgi:hypothetical protein
LCKEKSCNHAPELFAITIGSKHMALVWVILPTLLSPSARHIICVKYLKNASETKRHSLGSGTASSGTEFCFQGQAETNLEGSEGDAGGGSGDVLLDGRGAAPRRLLLLQVPLQRLRHSHLGLLVNLK